MKTLLCPSFPEEPTPEVSRPIEAESDAAAIETLLRQTQEESMATTKPATPEELRAGRVALRTLWRQYQDDPEARRELRQVLRRMVRGERPREILASLEIVD